MPSDLLLCLFAGTIGDVIYEVLEDFGRDVFQVNFTFGTEVCKDFEFVSIGDLRVLGEARDDVQVGFGGFV